MTTRREFFRKGSLWLAAATGVAASVEEIADWLKPRELYVNGWRSHTHSDSIGNWYTRSGVLYIIDNHGGCWIPGSGRWVRAFLT